MPCQVYPIVVCTGVDERELRRSVHLRVFIIHWNRVARLNAVSRSQAHHRDEPRSGPHGVC